MGPLLIFTGEFVSDSVVVNNFWEGSSKIGDKCKWEVAWSSIVDINGISGSDGVKLWMISFNDKDRDLWFINEAEFIEWESKYVDVKEIFKVFL